MSVKMFAKKPPTCVRANVTPRLNDSTNSSSSSLSKAPEPSSSDDTLTNEVPEYCTSKDTLITTPSTSDEEAPQPVIINTEDLPDEDNFTY